MDNVTHALAGCLVAAAAVQLTERRNGAPSPAFRRGAYILGFVTAELPDADLVYSGAWAEMGKLGYLLHHRGHTHTVLFAIASALVVWGLALALRRDFRAARPARVLLMLSLVGALSHVALDYTNSYGVHPWWPVDNRWVYGDAVFIIEPWFWIIALAPLFYTAQRVIWRVLASLLLLVILGAAWRVDMVTNGVAVALTIGAALWMLIVRAVPASRRLTLGIAAWCALEALFFVGAASGRRAVAEDVGAPLRDVVLSPFPGNPLCLSALVVTEENGMYGVLGATVAPFTGLYDAASCGPAMRRLAAGQEGERRDSRAIGWGLTWRAPVEELRALADSSCEISAALRFIRVPAWRREGDGAITFYDLRYGEGSFTSIVARPAATCAYPVPPWERPRSDVFGAAPYAE